MGDKSGHSQKLTTFQVKIFCGLSDVGNQRTEDVNIASLGERILVVLVCDFSSTTFRGLRMEAETQKVVRLLWVSCLSIKDYPC